MSNLDEQVWQKLETTQVKFPTTPEALLVLNDGETYTNLQNCTIVLADLIAIGLDGVDLDAEIKKVLHEGHLSKYVRIITRFA